MIQQRDENFISPQFLRRAGDPRSHMVWLGMIHPGDVGSGITLDLQRQRLHAQPGYAGAGASAVFQKLIYKDLSIPHFLTVQLLKPSPRRRDVLADRNIQCHGGQMLPLAQHAPAVVQQVVADHGPGVGGKWRPPPCLVIGHSGAAERPAAFLI